MALIEDYRVATVGKGRLRSIGTALLNPCFHAVVLFRAASLLNRIHLEPIAKLVWYINRLLFHVDIDYRASLAPGFRLIHGLGVVVGEGVVSDGPLTIYQGVTLGGTCGKSRMSPWGVISYPHFGSNCIVYTNACVFGPVIVADNAVVRAGRIVSRDLTADEIA